MTSRENIAAVTTFPLESPSNPHPLHWECAQTAPSSFRSKFKILSQPLN